MQLRYTIDIVFHIKNLSPQAMLLYYQSERLRWY
jgi:hypothetical protein